MSWGPVVPSALSALGLGAGLGLSAFGLAPTAGLGLSAFGLAPTAGLGLFPAFGGAATLGPAARLFSLSA